MSERQVYRGNGIHPSCLEVRGPTDLTVSAASPSWTCYQASPA